MSGFGSRFGLRELHLLGSGTILPSFGTNWSIDPRMMMYIATVEGSETGGERREGAEDGEGKQGKYIINDNYSGKG